MATKMDRITLAIMARDHWAEWLPEKARELKASGELSEAIQAAAIAAFKEISDLISQGYMAHEAEEVALKQYILLEPEELDDWESQELAEMEDDYQNMMREPDADAYEADRIADMEAMFPELILKPTK